MAGTLIVSNLKTDTDNSFIVRSNTGTTLFVANTTGIDVANSFASSSITSDKILTVANTKISGNITAAQITSVANTQITGNIASSQITSNPTLYGNVSVVGTASIGASDAIMTIGDNRRTVSTSTTTGAIVSGGGLGVWSDTYIGGNLSVAGGQIKFPATQSASSDANTLDDYEEGTWTPSIGGNATYSNQVGRYIKIGNQVFAHFAIGITLQGTGSTISQINGLPFASGIGSQNCSNLSWSGFGVAMSYGLYYAGSGSTSLNLSYVTGSQTALTNNPNSLINGAQVQGSIVYTV
jgi:hypothetical protein